ncbi:bHLH115 protein [Hibiscus syriacus]|uniref:BHLH115 protein n=1 Tax=Hibiscus syriacus TaxID=106335 RepID=A0A6A3CHB3_HIBSY|nr:bHLH115 protein [Hibiscus syriacus]
MDRAAILVDAVRMVTQLRDEAQKLRESNESLQEKINELKSEKNELRDEKQKLKTEIHNLERQVKALDSKPVFVPQATAIPTPFSTQSQVVGGKLFPLLAILEFPCGNSCLLLLLIHHMIIFYTLQSHRLAACYFVVAFFSTLNPCS